MPSVARRSLEVQWYRMALLLCPPVFRREHGDEMSRDFDELRGEAAARGSGALWTLRLVMAIDLGRTVGVQWLRTGVPVIALVAAMVQLPIAVGLAAFTRLATVRKPLPDHVAQTEADAMTILIMAVTILLIAMTIILNLWVARLNRRRARR